MKRALVIVFGVLLSTLALAQQAPIVRVEVEPVPTDGQARRDE